MELGVLFEVFELGLQGFYDWTITRRVLGPGNLKLAVVVIYR